VSSAVTTRPAPVATTQAATLRRRRRRKARNGGISFLYLIAALVLGIGIWQLAVVIWDPPSYIIPPPLSVWTALKSLLSADPGDPGGMWAQLGSTMEATLIGFAIGSGAGILFGVLAGDSAVLRRLVYPYLVALQSLPKVALGPLLATWFGFGLPAKTSLVVLFVFFPVLVNTLQGVVSADPDRIDLFRSLGASRFQQLYRVRLFSALPMMFTGLELGIVYAFLGAVLAEMTGAQQGVGVMISQFQNNSDTQATFALLIVLAIVGFLLNTILRVAHRRLLVWEAGNDSAIRMTSAEG
jgi:NitT/TauT family transport system permease protein